MSNGQPTTPPAPISPELQAFAAVLVANIRQVSAQENQKLMASVSERLTSMEENLRSEFREGLDSVESSLRTEFRAGISRVERTLEKQDVEIDELSVQVAKIEARLDEGDRRFEAVEGHTKEVGVKGQTNSEKLAELGARVAIGVGTGAAGGAAVGAAMGMFGH